MDGWKTKVALKKEDAGIGDCSVCRYHKSQRNPKKGVKIPGSYGKCIRPGGHCSSKRYELEIIDTKKLNIENSKVKD